MTTTGLFRNATDFQTVEAGATIFQAGDPGDLMYVIKSGEVEIEVAGKKVAELGAGEIFGEMALIDARPRSATAWTRSRCEIVPVDRKKFLYLVQQTPQFALQVMQTLVERLRALDESLSSIPSPPE
jgi:CRP/FNR family cyclic AMP-dependent transcriptional regulator